jgi:phage gp37-like protein
MNFETIETAILDRLKVDLPYVQTVETYAGQLEEEIEKLPLRFPAVFVVYKGSGFEWVDGATYNEGAEFTILAAAKNLKSPALARKDQAAGAYRLGTDILAALTNQNLDLNIELLRPVRCDLVYISKTVAIYGLDFQTSFDNAYPGNYFLGDFPLGEGELGG